MISRAPFAEQRPQEFAPPPGRIRYRLDLAYVGANFGGWQRQPNADTVQERLEVALSDLLGEPVTVVGASRTDAGVHARAQVVHLDLSRPFPPRGLVFGTNQRLSPEIRVLAAALAPRGFHARYSAIAKEYAYRVGFDRPMPPALAGTVLSIADRIDLDRMQAATYLLPGRHDFSCFALAGGSHRSPVRTLFRAAWEPEASGLTLRVAGEGFLRGMVRALAGTLLEVGTGKRTPAEFASLLGGGPRGSAGETAPAHALTLERIDYRIAAAR